MIQLNAIDTETLFSLAVFLLAIWILSWTEILTHQMKNKEPERQDPAPAEKYQYRPDQIGQADFNNLLERTVKSVEAEREARKRVHEEREKARRERDRKIIEEQKARNRGVDQPPLDPTAAQSVQEILRSNGHSYMTGAKRCTGCGMPALTLIESVLKNHPHRPTCEQVRRRAEMAQMTEFLLLVGTHQGEVPCENCSHWAINSNFCTVCRGLKKVTKTYKKGDVISSNKNLVLLFGPEKFGYACPKGGIHEDDGGWYYGQCKKCGVMGS